jgi:hypothetical protein
VREGCLKGAFTETLRGRGMGKVKENIVEGGGWVRSVQEAGGVNCELIVSRMRQYSEEMPGETL